jgi:hypothetical protein
MQSPESMASSYREAYIRLLQQIGHEYNSAVDLTFFWPLVGTRFARHRSLFVCGRAVNGWEWSWRPPQMKSEQFAAKAVDGLIADYEQPCAECPLTWVLTPSDKYNPRRSAFWRVAKRTRELLMPPSETWSSDICWSNLYKIAPAEGGNPPTALRTIELPLCSELLRLEVQRHKPRIALILAGMNWFEPFAQSMNLSFTELPNNTLVQSFSITQQTLWIVGKHPERKPENVYVAEIRSVLRHVGFAPEQFLT